MGSIVITSKLIKYFLGNCLEEYFATSQTHRLFSANSYRPDCL